MADDTPPPTLQSELHQRLPFRSRGHEAVVGLARSASVLDRAVACLLRPHGLSGAQYNVLRILQGAAPMGLPTLGIRDRMIDPAAAVTRLVDKLELAGLVRRERVGTDRRQVLVHITTLGLDKLAELDPLVTAVDAGVTAALSDAELREFNRLLGLVRAALAQGEQKGERERGRRGEI